MTGHKSRRHSETDIDHRCPHNTVHHILPQHNYPLHRKMHVHTCCSLNELHAMTFYRPRCILSANTEYMILLLQQCKRILNHWSTNIIILVTCICTGALNGYCGWHIDFIQHDITTGATECHWEMFHWFEKYVINNWNYNTEQLLKGVSIEHDLFCKWLVVHVSCMQRWRTQKMWQCV